MNIFLKKYYKVFNKKKYFEIKKIQQNNQKKSNFEKFFIKKINKIRSALNKKEINFCHSGHLGDIIYSLPVILSLSKKKKCNLYIKLDDSGGNISQDTFDKLFPLLSHQVYINKIQVFSSENIDIDFDIFREFPFVWFSLNKIFLLMTNINFDLTKKFLFTKKRKKYSSFIVIIRSLRRQNETVRFNFLKKYKKIIFLGLKTEYLSIKKQIPNIKFYECKNFLEMAEIINSCKLFIGNQSFGFSIAEALKVVRILEISMDAQDVIPFGKNGFDFYFQKDLENICNSILKKY